MKSPWRLAAELSSILPCALDFKYALIGMALGVAISAGFLALKICVIRRHLSDSDSADLKNTPQGKGPVTNSLHCSGEERTVCGSFVLLQQNSRGHQLKERKGFSSGLTVCGFWSMLYWSFWLVVVLHTMSV